MMFSTMLTDAFQNDAPGIKIRYRTEGKLFYLYTTPGQSQGLSRLHVC